MTSRRNFIKKATAGLASLTFMPSTVSSYSKTSAMTSVNQANMYKSNRPAQKVDTSHLMKLKKLSNE
jgi:hypothetical protein